MQTVGSCALRPSGWWYGTPSLASIYGDLSVESVTISYLSIGGGALCAVYSQNPCGLEWLPSSATKQIDIDVTGAQVATDTTNWTVDTQVNQEPQTLSRGIDCREILGPSPLKSKSQALNGTNRVLLQVGEEIRGTGRFRLYVHLKPKIQSPTMVPVVVAELGLRVTGSLSNVNPKP